MNFFFILMKNGTGFNKTGQFVLVSRVHLLGKFSQGWPAFPLHITIAVYTKLCFSATFSTHIGHEKVDRKEGKFLFTLCSVASDKRYSYVVFFVHVYQLCAHITQRSFLTFPLSVFSFFLGGNESMITWSAWHALFEGISLMLPFRYLSFLMLRQ